MNDTTDAVCDGNVHAIPRDEFAHIENAACLCSPDRDYMLFNDGVQLFFKHRYHISGNVWESLPE